MTASLRTLVLSAAAACVAVSGCSQTGVNTQIMITVDAQPGVRRVTEHLRIFVYGGAQGARQEDLVLVQDFPFDPSAETFSWPTVVAIAPRDRDATRVYRVEATAYDGPTPESSMPITTVRAFSGYVPQQTLWLRLTLQDDCIGRACGPYQTCAAGACMDTPFIPPETLPPWSMDAGIATDGASLDGGADAARTDGGNDCTLDGDCNDGHSCTEDRCGSDGCVFLPIDDACDDGEVCTDDSCVGDGGDPDSGCTHTPNTVACDDGNICNGFDRCVAGACDDHPTPRCGTLTCLESEGGVCTGCSATVACPEPSYGPDGPCTYTGMCATVGSTSRSVVSFMCAASRCIPTSGTDVRTCGDRITENLVCRSPSCTEGACSHPSTCAESGLAPRTCESFACHAGLCTTDDFDNDQVPCGVRDTDGMGCDDSIPCTTMDRCASGACMGTGGCDAGGFDAGSCADSFACTTDSFTGDGGCSHTPNNAVCNDLMACSSDVCDPGHASAGGDGCRHDYAACFADAGSPDAALAVCLVSPSVCNDFMPCTTDTCSPGSAGADSSGCVHSYTCSDGSMPFDAGDSGGPADASSSFPDASSGFPDASGSFADASIRG